LPPNAGAWAVFPALFIATLPQFAFDSAIVNNDALANLLAAAAIYYAYAVVDRPAHSSNYVGLGLSLGLGLLTKKTLLVLLPMVIVLLIAAYVVGQPKRRIAACAFMAVALTVLIAGGWYVRNYRIYGEFLAGSIEEKQLSYLVEKHTLSSEWFVGSSWGSDRAGTGALIGIVAGIILALVLAGHRGLPRAIRLTAAALLTCTAAIAPFFFRSEIQGRYVGTFSARVFTSFIGYLGQMSLPLPDVIYALYGSVLGVAAIGLFLELSEKAFRDLKVLVACGFFASALAGLTYYNLTFGQPQGRLLFPALSPVACLVTIGLYAFLSGPRLQSAKQCALIAILWLFAIADGVSIWRIYGY
jgi:4-amino-4-deoxy-L-arabinose transferase-like glycosyltransferase